MMYNQPSIEVCDDWLKTIASIDRFVFCCRLGPTATTTGIRQFHVGPGKNGPGKKGPS